MHVFEDTADPHTPDSIFPNNWVSFHADGTVVLYPMLAENRRLERRPDLLNELSARHGFRVAQLIDLTLYESPRTDLDVLGDFAQRLDYEIVAFEAFDAAGVPIYHTNVLMCIGARFAAICSACIREDERAAVVDALRTTGHEIVDLSMEQLAAFAGNMLELRTPASGSVVAMSARAHDSLTAQQRQMIEARGEPIVATPIPTIETLGGGSVRCMLAEIHLPKKK